MSIASALAAPTRSRTVLTFRQSLASARCPPFSSPPSLDGATEGRPFAVSLLR
ncbi:MAG: hypothetical protein AVDCRST_MAG90-1741 [uncultured Microvirga sp.]|uniref:Uncharacterized protein n=1 Tax=uncultured Microvirga sp. TaxID=412392 RepID=A0A6J4LMD3_9HYPH|nr:MAG: hypothetical protein AVDCRST_MAG90-1741 [uncultured Microvirga sp.]